MAWLHPSSETAGPLVDRDLSCPGMANIERAFDRLIGLLAGRGVPLKAVRANSSLVG